MWNDRQKTRDEFAGELRLQWNGYTIMTIRGERAAADTRMK